jgi:predicted nucleotidyltransferase
MNAIVNQKKDEIVSILKRHHVQTAALFGSVLRDDFSDKSDVDFLITFSRDLEILEYADNYFSLKAALESALGRSVDLLTKSSLKNPVLIEEINKSKKILYAA